ncbi:MAG: hypothetical protein PHY43_03905 [Verrucomicrobiales bacterium]|nr:hypothetical protein [Verrucomicrobiales bacterium]
MKPFYQPRNFRHELSAPEGCTPRVRLKPEMKCGIGVSASQSSSAATGAQSVKGPTNFIVGGSSGISGTTILLIVGAALAIWFFFIPKK